MAECTSAAVYLGCVSVLIVLEEEEFCGVAAANNLGSTIYFIVYPRVYPICTFYIHFVNILTQDSHQKHTLRLRCQLVIERF